MPITKPYHIIAQKLANDIKNGKLLPGEQLPPQREFAYQQNIAPSTASRVYNELIKRGLAIGEVGRGTFIREFDSLRPTLGEPVDGPINFQLNFSTLPGQAELMSKSVAAFSRPSVFKNEISPFSARKDGKSRKIVCEFLRMTGWEPDPETILFTAGGRQGIAAALAAIASVGDCIGVEYITYPIIKGIATRLGINLIPIYMDNEGLCIDSLTKAHKKTPLKALYFQPYLHNPLGTNTSKRRMQQIADFIDKKNIFVVEDSVYSFLSAMPPFKAIAPEKTFYIDSLSKILSPGLGFGILICPGILKEKSLSALRTGGWTPSNFNLSLCLKWLADGTAWQLIRKRRLDAQKRQRIAQEILKDHTIHTDPRSYHLWMELPPPWRAESFAAAASSRGVSISPASIFAIESGSAPNAVRIALAPPSIKDLKKGLKIVRDLALSDEVEIIIE